MSIGAHRAGVLRWVTSDTAARAAFSSSRIGLARLRVSIIRFQDFNNRSRPAPTTAH